MKFPALLNSFRTSCRTLVIGSVFALASGSVFAQAVPDIELHDGSDAGAPVVGASVTFTEVGQSLITGGSLTRTITITNTGTADLTGLVVTSGTPANATVTQPASLVVAPAASTTFTVTWTGGASTISVASNDPDENPRSFDTAGSVSAGGTLPSGAAFFPAPHVADSQVLTGRSLNFAIGGPVPLGRDLPVLDVQSGPFLTTTFDNAANGAIVTVDGEDYVAWYYGGEDHRDVVLIPRFSGISGWGFNTGGQLGNDSTGSASFPVRTDLCGELKGKTVVEVASGYAFNLALTTEGRVYSWGQNNHGQLGVGDFLNSKLPVAVDTTGVLAGKFIVAIACTQYSAVAVSRDGEVFMWGENDKGQLGIGVAGVGAAFDQPLPIAVDSGPGSALNGRFVVSVAAGLDNVLALTATNELVVWGANNAGQLGDGTNAQRNTPVLASTGAGTSLAGKKIAMVSGGAYHTLATATDGTAHGWGNNANGRIGDGTVNTIRRSPVAVDTSGASSLSGKSVRFVSAGTSHSLAVATDGTAHSWGFNQFGQLGDGTQTARAFPVSVDTGGALAGVMIKEIQGGFYHSLALSWDGRVFSWGRGQYGKLGDGFQVNRLSPVAVDGSASSLLKNSIRVRDLGQLQISEHSIVTYDTPPSDIGVFQGTLAGTPLVDNGGANLGNVFVDAPLVQTFTIEDQGLGDLTCLSVTIDGPNAAEFTITQPVLEELLPTGSTTFTVGFEADINSLGPKVATIRVANNDPDEDPFDIPLSLFAAHLDIDVFRGPTSSFPEVFDGQTQPVKIGLVVPGGSKTKTFTVTNTGNLPLTISGITVPDGATIPAIPGPIGPGGSANFDVVLSWPGPKTVSGHLIITHDAVNEAPFNFPILGFVTFNPGIFPGEFAASLGGDPVFGQPAGTRFAIHTNSPAVNVFGIGAFSSVLRLPNGSIEHALLAGDPAQVVVRASDPVPGVAGASFKSFAEPLINGDGHVAYKSDLEGPGLDRTQRRALFTTIPDGVNKLIMRTGTPDAATGSTFATLGAVSLAGQGVIFVSSTVDGETGLYGWDPNTGLSLLFRTGQTIDANGTNKTVLSFDMLATSGFASGQGKEHVVQASGARRITLIVKFTDATHGLVAGTCSAAGVYSDFGATYATTGQLVDTYAGAAAPVLADARWGSFRSPGWDQTGDYYGFVSFMEIGPGTVSAFSNGGVFVDLDPGQTVLQVREDQDAPGGGKFQDFLEVVTGAGDYEFAFIGDVKGEGLNASNNRGLWAKKGMNLNLLARGGSPAAGISSARWDDVIELALPSATQPVFAATLKQGVGGVTAANDVGLWMVTSLDAVKLALREGQAINVGGASRIVSRFWVLGIGNSAASSARNFTPDGIIRAMVQFTDGTYANIEIEAP